LRPAAAEAFIAQGWAPSMIIHPIFGCLNGVQAAAGEAVAIEWEYVKRGDYSTVPAGTRIRHREAGVTGVITSRLPPPQGDCYVVTWDRALPALLEPGIDPGKPMIAGCRVDGFDVLPSAGIERETGEGEPS
jgi:hypothetical protein